MSRVIPTVTETEGASEETRTRRKVGRTASHSSHAAWCAGHATRFTCFFPSRFSELTNSLKAQFRIAAPTYLASLPLSPHTCCITTHGFAASATLFTFSLILLVGPYPSR